MEIGFEFVAAQPKKRKHEDEPAQETMRGSRKIMSNPSTDQKKVRRKMVRKQADASAHCETCGSPFHTDHDQTVQDENLADDVDSAFRSGHSRPEDLERMLVNNPTGPSKYSALETEANQHGAPSPAATPHTTPEEMHPQGARPFPCKACGGWGQDAYGRPCYRCHGKGALTTSAANKDTHDFGGSLGSCKKCGMDPPDEEDDWVPPCRDVQDSFGDFDLDDKHSTKIAFRTAIARRASQVLNTPEENH